MQVGVTLALLGAAALIGCGSGGGAETGADAKTERIYPNVTGPTRQFLVANGDNSAQFYGREASLGERKEASAVLHGWLRARESKNWGQDCAHFHRQYRKTITLDAHRVTHGKVKNCAQALRHFGKEASGNLVNNLRGPIVSFRVRAGKGYAQYHGTDGKDWIVPMRKEEGHWRVFAATPIDRMK